MKLKINKVSIITRISGGDILYVETELPSGVFPYDGNAILKLYVANGTGLEYAKANFSSVSISVTDATTGKVTEG